MVRQDLKPGLLKTNQTKDCQCKVYLNNKSIKYKMQKKNNFKSVFVLWPIQNGPVLKQFCRNTVHEERFWLWCDRDRQTLRNQPDWCCVWPLHVMANVQTCKDAINCMHSLYALLHLCALCNSNTTRNHILVSIWISEFFHKMILSNWVSSCQFSQWSWGVNSLCYCVKSLR